MVFPRLNTGQVLQSIPAVRSWLVKPMVFPDLCGVKKIAPKHRAKTTHSNGFFGCGGQEQRPEAPGIHHYQKERSSPAIGEPSPGFGTNVRRVRYSFARPRSLIVVLRDVERTGDV